MKNAILILLLLVACSGASDSNKSEKIALPNTGQVQIIHQDEKFIIYGKSFDVYGSYSSHVVWAVDSAGNITHLATH